MNNTSNNQRIIGLITTIIVHLFLLLLFYFWHLQNTAPLLEEQGGGGLELNFGTAENGLGDTPPAPAMEPETKQIEESIITSKEEDAPVAVPENPPVVEKKPTKPIPKPVVATKPTTKPAVAIPPNVDKKSLYKKGDGQGNTSGNTDQGNSNGNPTYQGNGTGGNGGGTGGGTGIGTGGSTGNGISYSLAGRKPYTLPKPVYNSNKTGVIVVDIIVNAQGKVVNAKAGAKGTTISDANLRYEAEIAAMKATFSIGTDAKQIGTLTYRYIQQ